ncbi:MAG: NAD+ synthase [Gammaproteobacteria bacterium]|nr:NAD+ synthase [Gammaproteobacteria bacterium]
MTTSLRIALAQINPLVGDIHGNAERMKQAAGEARTLGAHLVVFPELSLTGYPPEDLLLRPGFVDLADSVLNELAASVSDMVWIVGHPHGSDGAVYNAASVLVDGRAVARYHKQVLPNYSVFDEKRYFAQGSEACVIELNGRNLGITICEDIWDPKPVALAREAGAEIILNLNASPFHANKWIEREAIVRERISEQSLPVIYVNQTGGQDELVFDGASFAMDASGEVTHRASAFEPEVTTVDWLVDGALTSRDGVVAYPVDEACIYQALVLGVSDYVNKNGFNGVVIGLSGGIDSALTLAIAVDALGADRVEAVMMPSRYTSDMSLEDAQAQASALAVNYRVIEIEPMFNSFLDALKDEFAGLKIDTTEENIQARVRGVLLMAISNKLGKMVLTTGNKSEMAVGYATLYGDMAGGFAAIKDVSKTLVYKLANWRNRLAPVIPQRVIDRPPSAELAPDQKDSDSLPEYPVLDAILQAYVENDMCAEEIVAQGFNPETVARVIRLVNLNEYKRRQAPPGVRISRKAFGRDRRYPITSGYRGKAK